MVALIEDDHQSFIQFTIGEDDPVFTFGPTNDDTGEFTFCLRCSHGEARVFSEYILRRTRGDQ